MRDEIHNKWLDALHGLAYPPLNIKLFNNKSMFKKKKSIRKEIEGIKGRANFSESVNSVHATEIANLKNQVSAMDARIDKMRNNIATDTYENNTLIMELAKTLGYTFTFEEHEGISDTTGEHDTVSKLVFIKRTSPSQKGKSK